MVDFMVDHHELLMYSLLCNMLYPGRVRNGACPRLQRVVGQAHKGREGQGVWRGRDYHI
jgi:hypothetical protein